MIFLGTLAVAACVATPVRSHSDDDRQFGDGNDRQPGLLAEYSDGQVDVLQSKASLFVELAANESPHPAIRSSDFTVQWRGTLVVDRPGTYRLAALVVGELNLAIDGRTLLRIKQVSDSVPSVVWSEPCEFRQGAVSIAARYAKKHVGRAVVVVYWQMAGQPRERLPTRLLFHSNSLDSRIAKFENVERGRRLVSRFGCLNCHSAEVQSREYFAQEPDAAPDFRKLNERVFRTWLFHWLKDPQLFRPKTPMPRIFGESSPEQADLAALVEYLAPDGVDSDKYDHIAAPQKVALGEKVFLKTGCIACHALLGEAPTAVAELHRLEGLHSKQPRSALTQRLINPTLHRPDSCMPDFELATENRSSLEPLLDYLMSNRLEVFERPLRTRRVPDSSLTSANGDRENRRQPVNQSSSLRRKGRDILQARRCLNCHRLDGDRPSMSGILGLDEIRLRPLPAAGCLADVVPAGLPDFGLSGPDRESIIAACVFYRSLKQTSRAPTFVLDELLARRGCIACHVNKYDGGKLLHRFEDSARERGVVVEPTQDVPDLTEVAQRLRGTHLRRVLLEGVRLRPWLNMKMPRYTRRQVDRLAELLAESSELHVALQGDREPEMSDEESKIGRLLVGAAGLNCVACHDWGIHTAIGTRAPDLATAPIRLRYSWFQQWLSDPQRIRPGTRMPAFFPNGRSVLPQHLGGNASRQIDAIWTYLARSNRLEPPLRSQVGTVVTGETNLPIPVDRPLMAHGFMINQAGLRGIAIGFPEKMSFAFDADTCQLTQCWSGGFVEIGDWYGSGRGTTVQNGLRIQGNILWRNPEGSQLAFCDRSEMSTTPTALPRQLRAEFDAHWLAKASAGFEYRLFSADRHYGVQVEEEIRPCQLSLGPAFRRRFHFATTSAESGAWLRIADRIDVRQIEIGERTAKAIVPHRDAQGAVRAECSSDAMIHYRSEGIDWLLFSSFPGTKKTVVWISSDGKDAKGAQLWIRASLSETQGSNWNLILCRPSNGNGALAHFAHEMGTLRRTDSSMN
jgi:mono/diheme cytochrome c family protein